MEKNQCKIKLLQPARQLSKKRQAFEVKIKKFEFLIGNSLINKLRSGFFFEDYSKKVYFFYLP